jgi:hypothetical protein
LNSLPKWQKYNQEYCIQNILSSLLNERNRFSRQKTAINFSLHMGNSMRHNGHRVVNELRRLKILRAPHTPYSSGINPCDFWTFGNLKEKLKNRDLQGPEEILTAFQKLSDNITFEELQMVFELWAGDTFQSLR